jgi:lycopene beta-cyclase
VEPASPSSGEKPSVGLQRPVRVMADLDEYVLVGGGLQNSLIALALLDRRPQTRLCLIERESQLGGNHTWCFHADDVPEAARALIEPLVVQRWPAHDVIFPRRRRRLASAYAALTSERLHGVVSARIAHAPNARILHASVRELGPGRVALDGDAVLEAELVVDARGPEPSAQPAAGYQKFIGLELALRAPSAPELPVLMDATVQQLDGFRFMYVLPFAPDRVLVEDTYYSTSPHLDAAAVRERVLAYADQAGMSVGSVIREEQGVLPIPTTSTRPPGAARCVRAGYGGGLFHPTTGYSLPVALRFALFLAQRPALDALGDDYRRWRAAHDRQAQFCLLLNRLLFGAFAPDERYHVLERFYGLPESTIRRFYALDTHAADRARILCGRPPRGFSLRRLLAGGPPA